MFNLLGNTDWIAGFVPSLESRSEQFIVNTDEIDEELVEIFIEELKRLGGELAEGMALEDSSMIQAAAHSVKGMGGTVGLPEVSVIALEIENLALKDALKEAAPMINALIEWMNSLG